MKKTVDFEKDLLRLEEIVNLLERGDCSLEEAMALFEEGAKLSGGCYQALQQAEQKISLLTDKEGVTDGSQD